MTYLLLPGRQIVNTRFQEEYLTAIAGRDLTELPELLGVAPAGEITDPVTNMILAGEKRTERQESA